MFTKTILEKIFERTGGCCHFCGDPVVFKKYGMKSIDDTDGVWEADHINQKAKGGKKDQDNCLPACYKCNRLRWHRKGDDIRELIYLGLIAKDQIKKNNKLGIELIKLKEKRLHGNSKRRRVL